MRLDIGNVPAGVQEEYSKCEEAIPFLENIPARASKWGEITGYKETKKPGWVEERYGGLCRIAMEMMLEEQQLVISKIPQLAHIGEERLRFMRPRQLFEAIDSTAVSPWVKYSLPLITRLLPVLYAESLVAIQPIPSPYYRIFFLDWNYGNTVPGIGANVNGVASPNTQIGHRIDDISKFNRFYDGWGYASTEIVGDGATTTFNLETASVDASKMQVWQDGVKTALSYTISAGSGPNGVDRIVFGAAPADASQLTITYGSYVEGSTPRDIDVSMSQRDVTVRDMATRIGWTVQSEQDFFSVHNIGIEPTLTGVMTWEAMASLDMNILMFLFNKCAEAGAGNVNWSSSGYLPGDTDSLSRRAYEETLYKAIVQADDLIWKRSNGRARASWMVCGSNASQQLRFINSFVAATPGNPGGQGGQANGPDAGGPNTIEVQRRTKIGMIDSTITCYVDPRVDPNKILLGYKSPNPFHLQCVYAPYRMFYYTGTLDDPQATFKKRKGVLNRAALEMVNSFGYATVTIT